MITIKEIAKMANVSIGTVDRIIHNRGRFSEETKKRVMKIIKETGYKTNIIASQLVKAKTYNFGIIMPHPYQNDKYWQLSLTGMERAKNDLAHFKISLRFYYYDRYIDNSFIEAYTKAVQEDNDGLLMAPVLSHLTEKCMKEIPVKIPYVLFNANIPDCDTLSFIGQDSFNGGMTAGMLMSILIKNKGLLAVICIAPEDYHINVRASGFESFFKGYRDVSIKHYFMPSIEEFNVFNELTMKIVSENRELKGIFVPNVSTHYFADAVAVMNLNEKIHIVGYDLIEDNVRCLQEGKIDFIINQQPIRQGYEGITTLYNKIVLKQDVVKERLLPIEIVARENLESYLRLVNN